MDRRVSALLAGLVLSMTATPAAAHVEYVTDGGGGDPVAFLVEVFSNPLNAALFGGSAVAVVLGLTAYLRFRPASRDVAVLRETLEGYGDLVPWMLRLALGLPLIGAGFAGYLFSPSVGTALRLPQLTIGFLLLFGLATRAVAGIGLLYYLSVVAANPAALLSMEYVPGLVAVILLGSGRPSADHMLQRVADAEGTVYGRIDPIHRLSTWFNELVDPYERYAPTALRVGVGITFAFLGIAEKLLQPEQALQVVTKYGLESLLPVDPGVWVVGAALTELAVGVALVLGLFTRATAALAFLVLSTTLFGLPDDPVLAHITLFGMASAIFTLGSGPFALDNRLESVSADLRRLVPA